MSEALVARLDDRAARLRASGNRGSRGDVVRMLLVKALDAEDALGSAGGSAKRKARP